MERCVWTTTGPHRCGSAEAVPDFAAPLEKTRRSAVHMEIRDLYLAGDESGSIADFKRTEQVDEWSDLFRRFGRGCASG